MNDRSLCLASLLAMGAILFAGCSPYADFVPQGTLEDEQSFGRYTVRMYREFPGAGGSLTITSEGAIVHARHGHCFWVLGKFAEAKEGSGIRIGSDITGDGAPNLVVVHWSGGAHCDYDYYVFSVGDELRLLDVIKTQHGCRGFKDVDGDGVLELEGFDWTFAYWMISFADSPAPKIILAYRDGKYRLAPDLMRTDPPDEGAERTLAESIRQHGDWAKGEVPPPLPADVLDLMYGGHAPLAWEFFDRAWPDGFQDRTGWGKEEFKESLLHVLSCSPYWPIIEEAFYPRKRW